ncbi:hypothetical protein [Cylindrospermopsis raciborskii]|uniref:hypothetical protein n=1 Tax=Cylindrospermopsis raciborskii TaxID=77022 RepID=UPI0022C2E628|nr:hypothetical protein [Cylindrospermopsis raciborskii]MCZ2207549.1 hypothetical protein [Cylindrospermopsis raciborskii PAMP2011]
MALIAEAKLKLDDSRTQYRENPTLNDSAQTEEEIKFELDSAGSDTETQVENKPKPQYTDLTTGPATIQGTSKMDTGPINDMITEFLNLGLKEKTPMSKQSQQGYIPSDEQAAHIKYLELAGTQVKEEFNTKLQKLIELIVKKDDKALEKLQNEIVAQNTKVSQLSKSKQSYIEQAEKVADKYRTVLRNPQYPQAPPNYQFSAQRTSPREIISVTGKFHPGDPKTDFNQVWSKLTAFGQRHYYEEEEYLTALRYVLEGEAYDAFALMTEEQHSLQYIIDYFAKVYGKKRSLLRDRKAVDDFTRHKNEPLDVCMHRSLVAIDRLQHLHSKEAWPEIRNTMRRNILTQIIADETRRHIQLEENEILEKTGLHIPIEKLINMAQKFETFHNKIPSKDVTTAFQVASGGFIQNIEQLKMENYHLKRNQYQDKRQITECVQELLANPARLYKNENRASDRKDFRRSERTSSQRQARSNSFDKNRQLTDTTPSPSRQSTPDRVTYKPRDTPPPLPASLQARRDRSASRDRSSSRDRNYNSGNSSRNTNYDRSYRTNRERSTSRDSQRSLSYTNRNNYNRYQPDRNRRQSRSPYRRGDRDRRSNTRSYSRERRNDSITRYKPNRPRSNSRERNYNVNYKRADSPVPNIDSTVNFNIFDSPGNSRGPSH